MSASSPSSWRYQTELIRAFGLLESEYALVVERLGREPNTVELGIIGAMWSEHCGYKHSRHLLKRLPTSGPRVIQGPGENAGVVSIGDGLAIALKMESHNHPSAVEPHEGAATGVGGILRDIFTMGARPVAVLDSLRFGDPDDVRTPHLVDGVIGGISAYGNCIGVPTVGGEIAFDPSYTGNPLVNVLCIGTLRETALTRAAGRGPGNVLLLVGADTGRDGIQGAAFASNENPETSHRGVIQVGNPFLEKLLLEACLEIVAAGDVVAMQDLGAAGLTSSSVEMAARGGLGVDLDVACVPRRETGMTAFEVMLSESQERMLLLVEPHRVASYVQHFGRWGLHAETIGRVTDDGTFRIRDGDVIEAELPVTLLADDVPAYELTVEAPAPRHRGPVVASGDVQGLLPRLLGNPNLCSRAYAYQQYDSTVQGNTVFGPGVGPALVRVEGTAKGIAATTACTAAYMEVDPRRGAAQAVAEAARKLACLGAEPIAVTDCLNFGNPEKPDVAWQMMESVVGLAEACRLLGVPVVSGNVSLYNESAGRAITPTPMVGMVGLVEDVRRAVPSASGEPGLRVALLGLPAESLGAGLLATLVGANHVAAFPRFDLAAEGRLGQTLRMLGERGLLAAARSVGSGGLAVSLGRYCMAYGSTGLEVTDDALAILVQSAGGDLTAALFSEDQGQALVAMRPEHVSDARSLAADAQVPWLDLGQTSTNDVLRLAGAAAWTITDLRTVWESGFQQLLRRRNVV